MIETFGRILLIIQIVTKQQQHRFSPGTEGIDDDDIGELLPDSPCKLNHLRSLSIASGLHREGPYPLTPRCSGSDMNDRVWAESPANPRVPVPLSDIRPNPRTPIKQRVLKHYVDGSLIARHYSVLRASHPETGESRVKEAEICSHGNRRHSERDLASLNPGRGEHYGPCTN